MSIYSDIKGIRFKCSKNSLNCKKTNERTFMICKIYRAERSRAAASAVKIGLELCNGEADGGPCVQRIARG